MKYLKNLKYLLFICLVLQYVMLLNAYKTPDTHPFTITSQARDLLVNTYSGYNEIEPYFNELPFNMNNLPVPLSGTQGTIDEDDGIRWMNHFYHPITGQGLLGFESAVSYSIQFWTEAKAKYQTGRKTEAYYTLGRLLHLLEDLSVPGHVNLDAHALGDDYEVWVQANRAINELNNIGSEVYEPSSTPENFLIEMANNTYNKIKIQGTLHESDEIPASGEIALMFNSPAHFGYIEYMNPDDGAPVRYWVISDVGEYYPDGDLFGDNEWWECEPLDSDPLDGHFYIENTAQAVPSEYKGIDNTINLYTLCRIWAIEENYNLLEDAVNYSAGLMKYFKDTAEVTNPDYIDIQTYPLYPYSVEMVPFQIEEHIGSAQGNTVCQGETITLQFSLHNYGDETYVNTELNYDGDNIGAISQTVGVDNTTVFEYAFTVPEDFNVSVCTFTYQYNFENSEITKEIPFTLKATVSDFKFTRDNGGVIIIGDEYDYNDSIYTDFNLNGFNLALQFELYYADKNWEIYDAEPNYDCDTGIQGEGYHEFSWQPQPEIINNLASGNYIFMLADRDDTGPIRKKYYKRRMIIVKPFAEVELEKTYEGGDDFHLRASCSDDSIEAMGFFQIDRLVNGILIEEPDVYGDYHTDITDGEDDEYDVGLYEAFAFKNDFMSERDIILGMSSVVLPEGPVISHFPNEVETQGHPIKISAAVFDGQGVGSVTLYYNNAGETGYAHVVAMEIENPDDPGYYSAYIEPQTAEGNVIYYIEAIDIDTPPNTSTKEHSFRIEFDLIPPQITATDPENGEIEVPMNVLVSVFFNEEINGDSVDAGVIQISGGNYNLQQVFTFSGKFSFRLVGLEPSTIYTCTIAGDIRDISGNSFGAGNSYIWSFTTKDMLPPAITEVAQQEQNFLADSENITFSCTISDTNINEFRIILKDVSSEEEYELIDPAPVINGNNYQHTWNSQDIENIPDGQYVFSIKAEESVYGLVADSEIQPFIWFVRANGTFTYTKRIFYLPGNDHTVKPNFNQDIVVQYNYVASPGSPKMKIHLEDEVHKLGHNEDRIFGGSGTKSYSVSANKKCWITGGEQRSFLEQVLYVTCLNLDNFLEFFEGDNSASESTTEGFFESLYRKARADYDNSNGDKATIIYRTRSVNPVFMGYEWMEDPRRNYYFERKDYDENISLVGKNEVNTLNFEIVVRPDDFGWTEVQTNNLIISELISDNPEVALEVLGWWVEESDENEPIMRGIIHATNTSLDIMPFIIDRHPPEILSVAEPEYFSPVVTDASQITCTITDNLPFILKDVSVILYDENNNVVRILYEAETDVQGTNRFDWDGTGSDAYNGGMLVEDGRYTYIIRAKDFAGNPSEYTGVIVVDSVVPELVGQNIAVIPAEHPNPDTFTTNDEKIEFSYLTADNLCPSVNIEIHFIAGEEEPSTVLIRESNFPITDVLQSIIYDWDGKDDAGNFLPDNHYTVVLYAEDLAGNRTTEVILGEFTIDRTPSVPETLYVDNPIFSPDDGEDGSGDGIRDTVTLHYLLTDNAYVDVQIEDILGRTIVVLDGGSEFKFEDEITWDGRAGAEFVSDGYYIFRIKTKDDVWNTAYASLPVIKNQVPAEILFPEDGDEDYSSVSGVVIGKGIALDPGMQDTQDFKWYKVWYREGADIDFNLPENNPLNPDTNIWHPIVVPEKCRGRS